MKMNCTETDVGATEMQILPMKHHWLSCGWENADILTWSYTPDEILYLHLQTHNSMKCLSTCLDFINLLCHMLEFILYW